MESIKVIRTDLDETTKKVRKMFDELTRNTLRTMPVWMKCNFLINQISNFIDDMNEENDKKINWDVVNEILTDTELDIDFNVFEKIHSIKELEDVRERAIIASVPEFHEPYYKKICKKCSETFTLTAGEVNWFNKKGLKIPCKCEYCRKGIEKPKQIIKVENKKEDVEPEKTAMQLALERAGII